MKDFRKKWFISASSGIFGKILLVVLCLGAGFVGGQYISVPIDKDIIVGAGLVIGIVVILFAFLSPYFLSMILEWSLHKGNSKIESQKLENENLKLKLELQEKQSQPDNNE